MRCTTNWLARNIESQIFLIRQHKVMLSTHLARLYEVEPKALVQAVKRNIERFPEDFRFQLTEAELAILKSQIVTSSWGGAVEPLRMRLPSKASLCSRACFEASAPFR